MTLVLLLYTSRHVFLGWSLLQLVGFTDGEDRWFLVFLVVCTTPSITVNITVVCTTPSITVGMTTFPGDCQLGFSVIYGSSMQRLQQ